MRSAGGPVACPLLADIVTGVVGVKSAVIVEPAKVLPLLSLGLNLGTAIKLGLGLVLRLLLLGLCKPVHQLVLDVDEYSLLSSLQPDSSSLQPCQGLQLLLLQLHPLGHLGYSVWPWSWKDGEVLASWRSQTLVLYQR